MIQLNDREASLAANALRLAAEQYERDAATVRAENKATPNMAVTHDGLAEQFDRQARDAHELAERLEG